SYYCQCFDGYSGQDCSNGPLCSKKYCENRGVCKHVGDSNIKCMCPYGYSGNKCEIHEFLDDEDECNLSKYSSKSDGSLDSFECVSKCLSELNNIELCRCHQNNEIAQGRIRFEASLRLGNASIYNMNEDGMKRVNLHYAALLEKYISRFLRNANISRINDLEIFNKT
ncbi:CLUMA_CG006507, isoform A, partial [Clunio marinus]